MVINIVSEINGNATLHRYTKLCIYAGKIHESVLDNWSTSAGDGNQSCRDRGKRSKGTSITLRVFVMGYMNKFMPNKAIREGFIMLAEGKVPSPTF